MLVLSRRQEQDLLIVASNGEVVRVRVLSFDRGQRGGRFVVRLGVDAPPGVDVYRGELIDVAAPALAPPEIAAS